MLDLEQFCRVVPDPRRPGKYMALVGCWCGRVYTLTPEEIDRHAKAWTFPCPAPVHNLNRTLETAA